MDRRKIIGMVVSLGIFTASSYAEFKPYTDYKRLPYTYLNYCNDPSECGITTEYTKTLYKLFNTFSNQQELASTNNYTKTASIYDNTMALLGYYNKKVWKDKVVLGEYIKISSDALNRIRDGDLKLSPDNDLIDAEETALRKYTTSLGMGILASYSHGTIANPNPNHLQNYSSEKITYYAFRVGQQALRSGVLKGHIYRVIRLKQEYNWLLREIDNMCPSINYDTIKLDGIDPNTNLESYSSSDVVADKCVDGYCNLYYMPIRSELRNTIKILARQLSGQGYLTCMSYLQKMVEIKTQIYSLEVLIHTLATNYSILNNAEKTIR